MCGHEMPACVCKICPSLDKMVCLTVSTNLLNTPCHIPRRFSGGRGGLESSISPSFFSKLGQGLHSPLQQLPRFPHRLVQPGVTDEDASSHIQAGQIAREKLQTPPPPRRAEAETPRIRLR